MRKKILIPLDAKIDLSPLRNLLAQHAHHDVRCVAMTYDVADQLTCARIPHEFRERAFDLSLLRKVNPFATELARKWFLSEALRAHICYGGINLGNLAAWELLYAVNVLIDRWLNIRELLCVWKPDEVVNVYERKPIRQMRFQHDESAMHSVIAMLRQEFKSLVFESRTVRLEVECRPASHWLKAYALRVARVLISRVVIPVLLRFYHILLTFLRAGRPKARHIVFYSGWWHFLPIVKELGRETRVRITLVQNHFGIRVLRKVLPEKIFLEQLPPSKRTRSDIGLWGKVKPLMKQEPIAREFTFDGICIWPLVMERFEYFWTRRLGELSDLVARVHKSLRILNPLVLIAENDTVPTEKTVIAVANSLGVRTIVLQHGATTGGEAAKQAVDHAYLPLSASEIAVFGKISRNFFLSKGVASERVKMTGCPRFDIYAKRRSYPAREAVLKAYGIPNNRKIIMYANTPSHKIAYSTEYHLRFFEVEQLWRVLVNAVDRILDAHLVVKMKGRDHQDRIDALDRRIGIYRKKNLTVVYEADLPVLLRQIDLMVASWSTLGLEALMVNKPLVTINFTGRPDPLPYVEMGAAVGVYQAEDVFPIIDKILHDESFRNRNQNQRAQFVRDYLISYRGDGAKRFIELLLGTTTENQHARETVLSDTTFNAERKQALAAK